jgi:hypothetical protein
MSPGQELVLPKSETQSIVHQKDNY